MMPNVFCTMQSDDVDDDVDDDSRLLLEQAADMIRTLMARCVSLAAATEKREARRSRR